MRRTVPALAAAMALALVVGCGGDESEEPADQGSQPQQEAKQGGDLNVMYAADVDKIDLNNPSTAEANLREGAAALKDITPGTAGGGDEPPAPVNLQASSSRSRGPLCYGLSFAGPRVPRA